MDLTKANGPAVEDCTEAQLVATPVVQMTEWDLFNNTAETPADTAEDMSEGSDD